VQLLDSVIKKCKKVAFAGFALHNRLFQQFTEDMPAEQITRWMADVAAWENDPLLLDPYFVAPSGMLSL
jgi:hypothetical protein